MNQDYVLIGAILMIAGVVLGFLFCLGFLLCVVGLVVLLVGLVEEDKPKTVVYYYGQSPTGYGGPASFPVGPPGTPGFCPHCGQRVFPGAVSCPGCGRALADTGTSAPVPTTQVAGGFVLCPHCGTQNPAFHKFCFACAKDLRTTPPPEAEVPFGSVVVCPKCGAKNSRTDSHCGRCDADLSEVKRMMAKKGH